MAQQLLLNSINYKGDSTFTFQFLSPQTFNNMEISLTSMNIYNSIPNITSALKNNQLKIKFPSGTSSYIDVTITFPDGFYDASSFNTYLISQMKALGLYTYDTETLLSTYYISLEESAFQYGINLTTYVVPTTKTVPNGFTSWTQLVATNRSPKVYFSKALGKIFGFNETVDFTTEYGGASSITNASAYSQTLSNICPQINDSNTVILCCDAVRNPYSFPSQFLTAVPIISGFGEPIVLPSAEAIYQKVTDGYYPSISLTLYDQNNKKLPIFDTNACFILTIRQRQGK